MWILASMLIIYALSRPGISIASAMTPGILPVMVMMVALLAAYFIMRGLYSRYHPGNVDVVYTRPAIGLLTFLVFIASVLLSHRVHDLVYPIMYSYLI
jgi:hypothetical protein